MLYHKRPLLFAALAFISGELVAALYSSKIFMLELSLFILIYLITGFLKGRIRPGGMIVLLLCSSTAFLRFQSVKSSMDTTCERLSSFQKTKVTLNGLAEDCQSDRITVKNARISLSFTGTGNSENSNTRSADSIDVGKVLVYIDDSSDIYPGETVSVTGKMSAASFVRNEGEFDFSLYYRGKNIHATMFGESIEKTGGTPLPFYSVIKKTKEVMAETIKDIFSPDDSGIYQAILLGDKKGMDEDLRSLYQKSGISHILAVSGLHLSILGGGLYDFLRKAGLTHSASGIFGGFMIICYGILTGSSGSAIRAVIMLLIRFLSQAIGRSYDTLSALSVSCILLLLESPYMLFSSGFQLSFLAVLALSLYQELIGCVKRTEKDALTDESSGRKDNAAKSVKKSTSLSFFKNAILASLFLQLFTLPILLYHSFQFPLYGIFLNLLVLPLMPYVVYSGLLGLLFSLPCHIFYGFPSIIGELLNTMSIISIGGGHYILRLYTFLCKTQSFLPKSSLTFGRPKIENAFIYYMLLLCIYIIYMKAASKISTHQTVYTNVSTKTPAHQALKLHKPRIMPISAKSNNFHFFRSAFQSIPLPTLSILLLFISLWVLLPPRPEHLEITALDVGQGDGFIIRFNGRVISIDNGSTSSNNFGKNTLEPYLLSQGIGRIDIAMISHCDKDHISGIQYLLEESNEISIGELLLPQSAENDERYNPLREIAAKKGTLVSYLKSGNELRIEGENGDNDSNYWNYENSEANYKNMENENNKAPLRFIVMYPNDSSYIDDANTHSTTMVLSYKGFQMLFTGDLPKEKESIVLKNMELYLPKETETRTGNSLEILKAGHHGSKTSTGEELINALKPDIVLLSYGVGNRYGHPHKETLDLISKYNIGVIETGKSGEIRITTNGEWYKITSVIF